MLDRGSLIYGLVQQARPVVLVSARATEARWGSHGVTVAMRAVLEVLLRDGPHSVPQLGRVLDISRQAVQRTVDELLRLDHVTATPNPAHRSSPLYEVTPAARTLFESLHAEELLAASAMAADFSDAEIEAARRVLDAIYADLRAHLQELAGQEATG